MVLQTNLDPRAWGQLAGQVEVGTSPEEPSAGGDLDTQHTHTINTVTLITVELREKTVGNSTTGWESSMSFHCRMLWTGNNLYCRTSNLQNLTPQNFHLPSNR